MASISTDKKGLRRILFVGADGVRRPIRLGRVPIKTARTIKMHVEALTDADFDQAVGGGAKSGALLSENAAQNPAQPMPADLRQPSQETHKALENQGLYAF